MHVVYQVSPRAERGSMRIQTLANARILMGKLTGSQFAGTASIGTVLDPCKYETHKD